ncbi:radical SAM protein [Clostridium sp. C8-1-8]|uniref:radical SAM protein n=1 Tax=Clostridium sp. C8-1-8 TaxID=2698831 RepID=UPI00136E843D|nr:radical SAM protein [Clostridium sp. C8-1-8]
MKYSLMNFIITNKGTNGIIFVDLLNSRYIELDSTEAVFYENVMNSGAISCKEEEEVINKLLDENIIIQSNASYYPEELAIFDVDFLKGNLSEFQLNQAVLELTTTCTFNCEFCDENSNKAFASCFCKRWSYNANNYDYIQLIETLLSFGTRQIVFQGGDPFNDKNSLKLIKEILDRVNKVSPNTMICFSVNGYSLNEEIINYLSGYKNILFNIQLIGFNEEEYFNISKIPDGYKRVLNNVLLLKAAKISVVGTFLISNKNQVNHSESFQQDIGIPISYIYLYNSELACKDKLGDYKQRTITLDISNHLIAKKLNGCLYGQLFFSCKQDVYPCAFLRDFKLGNLNENTLQEIIAKKDYRKFWFLSKSKIDPCDKCKYSIQCFDCRAIEYSVNKKLDKEYYCNQINGGEILNEAKSNT